MNKKGKSSEDHPFHRPDPNYPPKKKPNYYNLITPQDPEYWEDVEKEIEFRKHHKLDIEEHFKK